MATGISRVGLRYIMQRYVLLALFGVCLFAAAGSWSWSRGWAVLAACFVCEAVGLSVLALHAPETLNQRGTSHSGIKRFDIVFAALWFVSSFSLGVVAGLDGVRYAWSSLPWSAFGLGLGLVGAATALGTWAMVENEHFEKFVRIQTDRDHRVVTTGPYRAVRHPGYVAGILGALASPLMLGSVWSTIPALLLAALFVWRTSAENTTLQRELDGYPEYAAQTPHRLIPFLW